MITKRKLGIFILVVFSGILYWAYTGNFLDDSQDLREYTVERIIDGDTIVLNDSLKVRLIGINTPETGMLLDASAEEFLENLILNKSILLYNRGTDRYSRTLGYVFLNGVNINQEILRQGFGHLYYYSHDKNYDSMKHAELTAREKKLGIWAPSKNYGCLKLDEFIWLDKSDSDSERLTLSNICNTNINLTIKDDATHIYEKTIDDTLILETKDIWNDNGDSLYIWDEDGLVLFQRY